MRKMPQYLMPGVVMTRKKSVKTGAAALTVIVVLVAAWTSVNTSTTDGRMHIAVHTEQLADGLAAGTTVRTRGVAIGEVVDIEPSSSGRLRLDLALERSALVELDDSLSVEFAPANLFGISEVELAPGHGGSPLTSGAVVDLTGEHATRVYDATLSALLREFSEATGQVLTPQLSNMLHQLSYGVGALTPLLRTVIALARTMSDTQRLPASLLANQFGHMLTGTGVFASATVEVFDSIRSNQPLRQDRPHFDATVNAVVNDLLPAAVALGSSGERYLDHYIAALVPALATVSATVPHPTQSAAELHELLTRLHRVFADGPTGPVLQASVAVRGVPVLAQSLFSALPATPEGR
ncbi:MlaD family protein [Nocardia sp. NPDC003693]